MTKLEKVLAGLKFCTDLGVIHCHECPYEDECWVHDDGQAVMADALELLTPRVMTLEEIRDVLKQPVWKETKSAHEKLYTGWVIAYDIQIGHGITGERLGMSEPSGRVVWYRLDDYGRTWRCWTLEPTEAQREEETWE